MEWQTIETAPTNWANVLLWNGHFVFLGYYLKKSGWHDATNPDHDNPPEDPQPTHWMPLPSPPDLDRKD